MGWSVVPQDGDAAAIEHQADRERGAHHWTISFIAAAASTLAPITKATPSDKMLTSKVPSRRHRSTLTPRRRSALAITLTDDRAIAAAATTGDNSRPKKG